MKKIITLLILSCILLCGCTEKTVTSSSFMMDTVITYEITADNADALISQCDAVTGEIEKLMSAHLENSEVCRFNSDSNAVTLSPDTAAVIETALAVSRITQGAYDITVAPIVMLWGIGSHDFIPPTDKEIQALLPLIGYEKLTLENDTFTKSDSGMMIDLGGIAKGYALGKCAEYLTENNASGTVSFGGNIALIGTKADGGSYNIGIRDPFDASALCGVIRMDSGIVAVSGGYERYSEHGGVRYHHIISPDTGYPAESDIASAAVIVDTADAYSGALADALSTALFVMGSEKSMELYKMTQSMSFTGWHFEAVLTLSDGSVTVTPGLTERFSEYE